MASPRLAAKAPTACAACYLARPGVPHVDYGAAIEGGLIDPSRPRGGFVDWVVICEPCLRNGVKLLPSEEDTRVADLEAQLATERERADALNAYVDSLEQAIRTREHVHPTVTPVEKPAPKPRKARYEATR